MNEEFEGRGQGLEWTRLLTLNTGEHSLKENFSLNFESVKSILNFAFIARFGGHKVSH